MPLGVEVGLGPGHMVLGGDPAPPHMNEHSSPPPTFRSMSISAHVYCGRPSQQATAELLSDRVEVGER